MGNESFLAFTTAHLSLAEQNLARYRLRIVESPKLPLEKKPNPDKDGPDIDPNLWMWVNANIVYPPGKLEVPRRKDLTSILLAPQPPPKEEDSKCSKVTVVESLPPSFCEQYHPQKRFASSLSDWELTEEEEEEAEDQDDSSSVALPSPHKKAPSRVGGFGKPTARRGGSGPGPLNYFHLIALALRKSSPCGLNVQQIYTFTRISPFFQTAPEGWKNTVRHNLCFRDSFEKVPASMQGEASTRPRSCLWKLTEEGHRRFKEEARILVSTRLESIQKCMSQPDMMPFLFELEPC